MKPLLPVFCRPLGYLVIAIGLFMPMIMMLLNRVTESNLLLYKECAKLLIMVGALMILFAYSSNETKDMGQVRAKAVRNAMFLTVVLAFANLFYRLAMGDIVSIDSSSFIVFLLINVLTLEFSVKKKMISRAFKREGQCDGQN